MNDGEALYEAILAQPAEDTPRLMYADWLDEHGNPDRAEFIRAQCQEACREWLVDPSEGHTCAAIPCILCEDEQDRNRLWKNERRWIETNRKLIQAAHKPFTIGLWRQGAPVDDREAWLLFRRGFVDEARCTLATFLANAPALARFPITRVRLTDREPSGGSPDTPGAYYWFDDRRQGGISHGSMYLPAVIYDLIEWGFDLGADIRIGPATSSLTSYELAQDALSAACVQYLASLRTQTVATA